MTLKPLPQISRHIYYYELTGEVSPSFAEDEDPFVATFREIIKLVKSKDKARYMPIGEKRIFMNELSFEPENKLVYGKLLAVRMDILPSIIDTLTDTVRDVTDKEQDGLIETTHFIFDYRNKKTKKLALEMNAFGGRVSDFYAYLEHWGKHFGMFTTVNISPHLRDILAKLDQRLGRVSQFDVKVYKDNIPSIKQVDQKMASICFDTVEAFRTDYVELTLKFDYRKHEVTPTIVDRVIKVAKKFADKPELMSLFEKFSIRAEDKQRLNKLEVFDLLEDRVRAEIKVQKREKYRTLISVDMFDKMKKDLLRRRSLL